MFLLFSLTIGHSLFPTVTQVPFSPHLIGPQTASWSSSYLRLIHVRFPPLSLAFTQETVTATGQPVCLMPLMIPISYRLAEIESPFDAPAPGCPSSLTFVTVFFLYVPTVVHYYQYSI